MGLAVSIPPIFDPFGFQRAAAGMLQAASVMMVRSTVETAVVLNTMKEAGEEMVGLKKKADSHWDIPLKSELLLKTDFGPCLFHAPEDGLHGYTSYNASPISFSKAPVINPLARGFAEEKFNVVVNDWPHPKDCPAGAAHFTMDKQIDILLDGLIATRKKTGYPVNVITGASQVDLAVALATTILEQQNDPAKPGCMILFGGPYNIHKNLTHQNRAALVAPDDFWDSLFPRMPKPLLHDMVQKVFKDPTVAEGRYVYRGKYRRNPKGDIVDPAMMTKTPVMVVEGLRDILCPVKAVEDKDGKVTYHGQTSAFFDRSLLPADKRKHLVLDTDHYGVFDLGNPALRKAVIGFVKTHTAAEPVARVQGATPRATAPVQASTLTH